VPEEHDAIKRNPRARKTELKNGRMRRVNGKIIQFG
jgi:hypothetical protein